MRCARPGQGSLEVLYRARWLALQRRPRTSRSGSRRERELTMQRRVAWSVFLLLFSVVSAAAQTNADRRESKPAATKTRTVRQLQQDLDDLSGKYDHLEKELADM